MAMLGQLGQGPPKSWAMIATIVNGWVETPSGMALFHYSNCPLCMVVLNAFMQAFPEMVHVALDQLGEDQVSLVQNC